MYKILIFSVLMTSISLHFSCTNSPSTVEIVDGWHILFNGEDLNGWSRLNGNAEFTVEEGQIIGTTKRNTPNTFLTTDQKFGNFALEFEVKIDTFINSGVQFRSNSTNYMSGKVHGYQAEIDPSSRAWSGGIYDESRRGWLFPMGLNPSGGKAYKPMDWNKIYVEAIGPDIKTWVNDVPAAYLIDDMTMNGFIALQIHSIDRAELVGRKIRWRNIRLKENPEAREGNFPFVVNTKANDMSEAEKRLGWVFLFDGTNTDQWKEVNKDEFPGQGWKISEGNLCYEKPADAEVKVGDLVTRDEFGSFDFQLEFNLSKGGNSGIKYFVTGDNNTGTSGIGLEYQIIDDKDHPLVKEEGGLPATHTLASLYDLIEADKPDRFVRPPGEWNHIRIVSRPDNTVEHWLNYIKVLEYKRGSRDFLTMVKNSKYKDFKNFGLGDKGHILLQNHGDEIKFRNIKIKPVM